VYPKEQCRTIGSKWLFVKAKGQKYKIVGPVPQSLCKAYSLGRTHNSGPPIATAGLWIKEVILERTKHEMN
jgi:hypothetical protein